MEFGNITYRKPKRSSSLQDMSDLNSTSTLFDATVASLPNASLYESQNNIDLNEKINKLSSDLLIAHQEIDNLNSENTSLKLEIEKYQKIIKTFKKITTYSSCNTTPASVNKRRQTLQIPEQNLLCTPINRIEMSECSINEIKDKEQELVNNIEKTDSSNHLPNTSCHIHLEKEDIHKEHTEVIATDTNTNTSLNTPKTKLGNTLPYYIREKNDNYKLATFKMRRKIIVIADQQGRNICKTLQKLIGDNFLVTCYWKPGAKIQEVLQTEKNEICKLTKNDYVVVLGGVNENNPYEFEFCIRSWLYSVTNTNVIFTEIPYNRNLNIGKLNYVLRFICTSFTNVSFINTNGSKPFFHQYTFTPYIPCRFLLREILRLDYKLKFELYQNIVISSKFTPLQTTSTQTDNIEMVDTCTQSDDILKDNIIEEITPRHENMTHSGKNLFRI
ncbi:unnamed protein product [Parnassius apollo]|uniref:(apollo) hypothetical protein n=1 Tax=Parnassius apollo TaxID=110799 RepID=A0A8S3WTQ5_PARAO|nr:unnamed protein product [Parnassius apollo]